MFWKPCVIDSPTCHGRNEFVLTLLKTVGSWNVLLSVDMAGGGIIVISTNDPNDGVSRHPRKILADFLRTQRVGSKAGLGDASSGDTANLGLNLRFWHQ